MVPPQETSMACCSSSSKTSELGGGFTDLLNVLLYLGES